MDQGHIVALDSPGNLIRGLGDESRVVFSAEGEFAAAELERLSSVTRVESAGDGFVVYGRGDRLLPEVVNALSTAGLRFRELHTERSTLEDVFLALTGRRMRG
jgi:ABC-2 type transport system ATP-binding protein